MRLFPPAYSFGREALEPCEVGGWTAPEGTTLFVFPWLLHHDPRWYERQYGDVRSRQGDRHFRRYQPGVCLASVNSNYLVSGSSYLF